jgi:RHS repeat-associated protein
MKEYVERHYSYDNPITEFFYDANGNMTADLDRDIVTIKYNLLNLPELIQFKNGCQIKHTYSAGGQKLSSRYITVNAGVYQPLNQGQVIENLDVNENDNVTVDGMDYIGNVEYQIYRYFDWDVTFEPAELKYIYRIHNPEGFATNATTTNGPIYSYYRKDHLGNNREVWRASYTWGSTTHPAATVQRTQYYPSGLPWKYNIGDNPGSQPYKYGGKKFVEMHGLDEYDSEARWYYPAIMRTTTMDPLAEKYYDISPYAWCGNNPVRYIDPFGMDYWSTNNPMEIQRFMESLQHGSNSISESFDFSSWKHATDAEFTGNLSFNDETNTFHTSYGMVENGEFFKNGISIKALNTWEGGASIQGAKGKWFERSSGRTEALNVEFDILTLWRRLANMAVKPISNRALFSGADSEVRAIQAGYQTLSQTRAGQNLAQLTKGMPYYGPMNGQPAPQAWQWWARLSKAYVKGIPKGSKVPVFLNNPSQTGIWNLVEKPYLLENGYYLFYP